MGINNVATCDACGEKEVMNEGEDTPKNMLFLLIELKEDKDNIKNIYQKRFITCKKHFCLTKCMDVAKESIIAKG